MKEYIAIDVETTGLDSSYDRIVELGAVHFNSSGEVISQFQSFVNPQRVIPENVISIHGITDEMVAFAPGFDFAIDKFMDFIGWNRGAIQFLAHNALFDVGFINAELKRYNIQYSPYRDVGDTLMLARKFYPRLKSYSLPNLVKYLCLPPNEHHRSISDCVHLKNLFMSMNVQDGTFMWSQKIGNVIVTEPVPLARDPYSQEVLE